MASTMACGAQKLFSRQRFQATILHYLKKSLMVVESVMTLGTLYIVSAPSGAGKTSLISALLEKNSGIEVSVSHTTRPMRDGEVDGHHYHFVSVENFRKGIEAGVFLEYAQVFDNFYGTSKSTVKERLEQGIDVILEIDWQGAQQIRQLEPEACSIFILPPSIDALEQRLRSRNQDSDEVIARRLAQAKEDATHFSEYDYVIINQDFETALEELQSIFISRRVTLDKSVIRNVEILNALTS